MSNELLAAIGLAQERHEVDVIAELRRRVRGSDHPTREHLPLQIARRDDVLLRRLAERLDVDVFVEDRIADDQATHSAQGAELGLQLPETDLPAQILQIFGGVLGKGLQRAVGETSTS